MQQAKHATSSRVAGSSTPGNNKITLHCSCSTAQCRKWGKHLLLTLDATSCLLQLNWLFLLTLLLSDIFIPFSPLLQWLAWEMQTWLSSVYLAFPSILVRWKQDRWKLNSITSSSAAGKKGPLTVTLQRWSTVATYRSASTSQTAPRRNHHHGQGCYALTMVTKHNLISLIAANEIHPENNHHLF